jgi:hypothetical protein
MVERRSRGLPEEGIPGDRVRVRAMDDLHEEDSLRGIEVLLEEDGDFFRESGMPPDL